MDTIVPKTNTKQALEQLQQQVESILMPLGYEVVALDVTTGGGRKVALFIDFLDNQNGTKHVGLDDCLAVNRAVDELFETTTLIDGHFTLEVSSPGVERPLRKLTDFKRFTGKKAKLHTFRPLESAEIENEQYWEKNKKQKHFSGILEGVSGEKDNLKVQLNVDGKSVKIPFELVSKAHLEVEFKTE